MMSRFRSPRHILATATILAASFTAVTVATLPAAAAPAPLTPLFPIGSTPTPMTPAGSTGYQVSTRDGSPISDGSFPLAPGATTTYVAHFRQPAATTGRVIPPADAGDFTVTATGPAAPATSSVQQNPTGPLFGVGNSEQPPVGTAYSDSWVIANNPDTWTYRLDFSTLTGGVLPAGSVFWVNDVDVCGAVANEIATFSSNVSASWLEYYADSGSGTPGAVTGDSTTGQYVISSTCPTGANGVTQSFRTASAVSHVTITLQGADPGTTPLSGLWWGIALPVQAAAPAVTLTKLTNGHDVTAAPGPTLTIGHPVTWTYRVTNTGNTALTDVTVTDDQLPATTIDCGAGTDTIPLLAAGATATCTATGTVTTGAYTNIGTVTGTPALPDGTAIPGVDAPTATDQSWYTGVKAAVVPPVTPPTVTPPTVTPPASPAPPSESTTGLASTGTSAAPIGTAAVAALLLGTGMLWAGRRGSHTRPGSKT
jgi:uncharacterized repeat protein (TIGR01451 family)